MIVCEVWSINLKSVKYIVLSARVGSHDAVMRE